jgi:hypothetical protein
MSDKIKLLPADPTFTRLPGAPLTWREKTLIRILLIVAAMFADETEVKRAVKELATHISVARREEMAE